MYLRADTSLPNEGEMAWVMGSAVRRLAELNGDHAHSYSDAELLNLLEEALTEQRPAAD